MEERVRCIHCFSVIEGRKKICPICGFAGDTYHDPPEAMKSGTVLQNRYYVGELLSSRKNRLAYQAFDQIKEEAVFLREIRGEKSFGQSEKILSELFDLLSVPVSEGIVAAKGQFYEAERHYLVLEYVAGETLPQWLSHQRLTEKEMKNLLAPVAEAICQLHKNKKAHGSIRPDRILVLPDGKGKLLDPIGIVDEEDNPAKAERDSTNGKRLQRKDVHDFAVLTFRCLSAADGDNLWESEAGREKLIKRLEPKDRKALRKAMEAGQKNRGNMEEFYEEFFKEKEEKIRARRILAGTLFFLILCGVIYVLLSFHQIMSEETTGGEETAGKGIAEDSIKENNPYMGNGILETAVDFQDGSYLMINTAFPDLVLSIDSGFSDDGASLMLEYNQGKNRNHMILLYAEEEDTFEIRAGHTNSRISRSQEENIVMQNSREENQENYLWRLLSAGYDADGNPLVKMKSPDGQVLCALEQKEDGRCTVGMREEGSAHGGDVWLFYWDELNDGEAPAIVYGQGQAVTDLVGRCRIYSAAASDGRKWLFREDSFLSLTSEPEGTGEEFELIYTGDYKYCLSAVETGQYLTYDSGSGHFSFKERMEGEMQEMQIIYAGWNQYQFIMERNDICMVKKDGLEGETILTGVIRSEISGEEAAGSLWQLEILEE